MRRRLTAFLLTAVLLCLPAGCVGDGTPSLTPVPPEEGGTGYVDVPADAACAQAVVWCRENNLMNGVSAVRFDPEDGVTRAVLATALYRAAGQPKVEEGGGFSDVPADAWYADAVVWVAQEGIIRGYPGGSFAPNEPVIREQLDMALRRYRGEDPEWTGDPALAVAVSRAEVAMALMDYLRSGDGVSRPGERGESSVRQINVSFNGRTYTATLADNSSAVAFAEALRQNGGSITVGAGDYGGFEKVGPLGRSLVTNDEQITTSPGDIILYQGDNICLYYAVNTWSFTRLGRLEGDLSNLRADLGAGDVSITYSLP